MGGLKRIVATTGNGVYGRLGHGLDCVSSKFFRIVGSLIGYDVKDVACGGAHTCVVTGASSGFVHGQPLSCPHVAVCVVACCVWCAWTSMPPVQVQLRAEM